MMKADLETNVEALVQEIDFLKGLYEEVPAATLPSGGRAGASSVKMMGWESSGPVVCFRASRLKSEHVKKSVWDSWFSGNETLHPLPPPEFRSFSSQLLGLCVTRGWEMGSRLATEGSRQLWQSPVQDCYGKVRGGSPALSSKISPILTLPAGDLPAPVSDLRDLHYSEDG